MTTALVHAREAVTHFELARNALELISEPNLLRLYSGIGLVLSALRDGVQDLLDEYR